MLLLFFFCGMQADDVKLLGDDTYSLAISPNGKYVVIRLKLDRGLEQRVSCIMWVAEP